MNENKMYLLYLELSKFYEACIYLCQLFRQLVVGFGHLHFLFMLLTLLVRKQAFFQWFVTSPQIGETV